MTWPSYAHITGDYELRPQSDVLRTPYDDGAIGQAQIYAYTLLVRRITIELSGADFHSFQSWSAAEAHTWFSWIDPIDGSSRRVRVRGGAGGIEYRQIARRGTPRWEATLELEEPPNLAPFANAGADQTVVEGQSVTLDGSASYDPDGQSVTYAWSAPEGVALSDPAVADPTFVAPDVTGDTTYTITLEVSDGVASATHSVDVTVENERSPAFASGSVAAQTYTQDSAITELALSLTLGNGANDDHVYQWSPDLPDGLVFDHSDPADLNITGTPTAASAATSYTLSVSDLDGDVATLVVTITVNAPA